MVSGITLARRIRAYAEAASEPDSEQRPAWMAKDYGTSMSALPETALTAEVIRTAREHWRDANADAIAAYNDHVDKAGTFSDGLRSF